MKVIFLLDNNEYVEVDPEVLQLRQLSPGQSALGLTVTVPATNEDGSPILDADGKPAANLAFRPFINYAVDLVVPTEPSALIPPLNVKEVTLAPPAPGAALATEPGVGTASAGGPSVTPPDLNAFGLGTTQVRHPAPIEQTAPRSNHKSKKSFKKGK